MNKDTDEINKIDIKENYITELDPEILKILLLDRTSKKNIIWATDIYKNRGYRYFENEQIFVELVTGKHGKVIKPRTEKSKKEQQYRSRNKAEVFTPSWICNRQNNLVDNAWFGRSNVFNIETNHSWKTNTKKIDFQDKDWKDYVQDIRLEISCGEAPYIVSRYDTVTGEIIPVEKRIGILDRKIRIVNENVNTKDEWIEWVKNAFKSVYGFDFQGDNVLIARENLLFTLIDNYKFIFKEEIEKSLLLEFAEIISWNIWQMDGMKFVIPNSCKNEVIEQLSFFDNIKVMKKRCYGCEKGNYKRHNGKKCVIMDWKKEKKVKFVSLIGG